MVIHEKRIWEYSLTPNSIMIPYYDSIIENANTIPGCIYRSASPEQKRIVSCFFQMHLLWEVWSMWSLFPGSGTAPKWPGKLLKNTDLWIPPPRNSEWTDQGEPRGLYFNQHKWFEAHWSKIILTVVSNSGILLFGVLCPISGSIVSSFLLTVSAGSHHRQSQALVFWRSTYGKGSTYKLANR